MDLLLFHLPPKVPKKAKKKSAEGANSNVFSIFEQSQIQEFNEVRISLSVWVLVHNPFCPYCTT